jgi:serine/threonine-protein kinase
MKGYRIISELGSGGYGKVFLAQREGSGSLSVIKTLHEKLALDVTARSRFLREAQLGALLDHDHVARLEDAWFEGEVLWTSYELVPGHDLEAITMKRALPPAIAVGIMVRVLAGLHHAHELRGPDGARLEPVHRDVSPKNVMIGYGGEVKLIDFGIARAPVGAFRTQPGVLVGTLRYLSPEQAAGAEVDRRSDVYSAGAVLFELLAGRPLVEASEMGAILRAISLDGPPPVMPRLDPVIARALKKDRSQRYATALELKEAIVAAVPDLARTETVAIGGFVSALFPEAKASTELLLAAAKKIEPPADATRLAPVPQPRSNLPLVLVSLSLATVIAAAFMAAKDEAPPAPAPVPGPAPPPDPIVRERAPSPSATPIAEPEPAKPPSSLSRRVPPPAATKPAPRVKTAAARPVDPSIRALRDRLRSLREGSDPARLFDLGEDVRREAERISDPVERGRVQAKAHASVQAGDLNGLASAIEQLERAR